MISFAKFFLITVVISLKACWSNEESVDNVNAELIKICIDETLKLDPGTSTKKYCVDFGDLFNAKEINIFLKKTSNVKRVKANSLFKNDQLWIGSGYFQNTLIQFIKIEHRSDGTLYVIITKTLSSDGANGAKIILEPNGHGFKLRSSEITWIS